MKKERKKREKKQYEIEAEKLMKQLENTKISSDW
jgi:hypothetical protein